jgi:hypothetical protein
VTVIPDILKPLILFFKLVSIASASGVAPVVFVTVDPLTVTLYVVSAVTALSLTVPTLLAVNDGAA